MDILAVIILLLVIVGAIVAVSTYNSIIACANGAQRAWADVLTYERQKTRTLEDLTKQADGFKEHEKQLMMDLTSLREAVAQLPATPNGDALKPVESNSQKVFDRIKLAVEAYPELSSSGIVASLMKEIAEQQANVGAAISVFNGEVERFNNSIQFFVGSQINNMLLHHQRIIPFSDSEASSSFEYQPNFS
ncbi:MAG: LemA family protein [Pseudomonas sp.]